jgi:hypothetical protein
MLGQAETFFRLFDRQEFRRTDRVDGWCGELDIAAGRIVLAGQGIKTVDGAVHLHGIGMHFCAGPAFIARWQGSGEQTCCPAHVFGCNPRDIGR